MALPEHCAYCFDVLIAACSPTAAGGRSSSPPPLPRPRGLEAKQWQQEYPLFVTFNKLRRTDDVKSGYSLRGCIGCFSPLELESGLADYTIKSALEDTRFTPVVASEIPQLQCAVSLLMNFTPAAHAYDWVIGTHGIRIEFHAGGRRYSATYLPEVAAEQGWTHERTISSLIVKAGYNRSVSRDLLESIKTTRYQSSKHYMSYADYVALRSKPPVTAAVSPAAAALATAAAAVATVTVAAAADASATAADTSSPASSAKPVAVEAKA